MKQVIVTGANGFIGTNLLKLLSGKGIEVIAVVRNTSSLINSIKNLPHVKIVYCDMDDLSELSNLIPYGEADTFFHLAWNGAFGKVRENADIQLHNVQWTVKAVRAAHAVGCQRFVGVGTIAEYDINKYVPQSGSVPAPVSCYGIAKIAAHYMSKTECNKYHLIHNWARLSHIYGIGDYTTNFVNFASKIMITGQPANFVEGNQYFDFLSVNDAVQGLYCIGESGKANTAYYVVTGHPKPLKEYIKMIRDAVDPSIALHLGAVSFNEIARDLEIFDSTPLSRDTGYQAKISFAEGIKTVIPWIKEQIDLGNL